MKNKRKDRKSEVERMLARVRPDLERVKKPRRKKSRAAPDGFTAEANEMRVHAVNWIGAHGHAYRDLAERWRLDPAKFLGDEWKDPLAGLDLSVLTKPGLEEKGLSRVGRAGRGKSRGTKGEKANSALILVRQKAGKRKHPPHPAKHVLISRTTGRIRGEQG